jgi:hypothetical protein
MTSLQDRKDTVARFVKKDILTVATGPFGSSSDWASTMLADPVVMDSVISAVWKGLSGPGIPPARAKDPPSIRAKLLQLYPGFYQILNQHAHPKIFS